MRAGRRLGTGARPWLLPAAALIALLALITTVAVVGTDDRADVDTAGTSTSTTGDRLDTAGLDSGTRTGAAATTTVATLPSAGDVPPPGPASTVVAVTTTAPEGEVWTPQQIGVRLEGADPWYTPLGSDAARPSQLPPFPGGASGYSHFVFEEVGGEIRTTLVEGPAGPQVRYPLTMRQLDQLVTSGAPVPAELDMTRGELRSLRDQLYDLRDATEKYADVDAALADGYRQTTNEVPNMGAHFNRVSGGGGGDDFDPASPEILMYSRDGSGTWQLVGTSFVVSGSGGTHPTGFSGPVDNWHIHYDLCSGNPLIVSRSSTREECQASGGHFLASYGWMIHAWVAVGWDNPLGIFHMWNPLIPPAGLSAEQIRTSRIGVGSESGPGEQLPRGVGTIIDFAFSQVRVSVGDEMVWTNADWVPHTVTFGRGGIGDNGHGQYFDSGLFDPGDAFTHTFSAPGTYSITCLLHPQMNGTVIVE